jgi:hypothetical protein
MNIASSNKLQRGSDGRICRSKPRGARGGRIARLTRQEDPPVRAHLHPRKPLRTSTPSQQACGREAEVERSHVVLAASGVCFASTEVVKSSAGQDLVGGIDHGPNSNQPVHHLRMAAR